MFNRRKKARVELVVNLPRAASFAARYGGAFAVVILWAAFAYLWAPLIYLAAWALNIYNAYDVFDYLQKMSDLQDFLILYCAAVLIPGSVLLLWSFWEYHRFNSINRRNKPVAVDASELDRYAKKKQGTMIELHKSRRIVVHHDAHGNIKRIFAEDAG